MTSKLAFNALGIDRLPSRRCGLCLAGLLLTPLETAGQPSTPEGAVAAEEPRVAKPAEKPTAQPDIDPSAQQPTANPWADTPQAALARLLGRAPEPISAQPDDGVPADCVHASVSSTEGDSLAQQSLRLGTLHRDGRREGRSAASDASGTARWCGLSTGQAQAYRISYQTGAARVSSRPFRLDGESGMRVTAVVLESDVDERAILLARAETSIEFRENRAHVSERWRLSNLAPTLFLLPEKGKAIDLPEGVINFESQQGMGDQRVRAEDSTLLVSGSIPPGSVELTWSYDLRQSGESFSLQRDLPFRLYQQRVVVAASEGMALSVDGAPPAMRQDFPQGSALVAEVVRRPTDPPVRELRLTITGIPGPGPARWLAVLGALSIVVLILATAWRRPVGDSLNRRAQPTSSDSEDTADSSSATEAHTAAILGLLRGLEEDRARQDVGEGFYARRRRELIDALAFELSRRPARAQSST